MGGMATEQAVIQETSGCDVRQAGLVVVGAGLAALHVVARLPENILKDTVVVDRQGGWLAGWRAGHAALGTRLLRSPVNQSPSTNPTALREFAKAARMEASMETALPGFLPLPTPSLQDAFCQKKLVAALPPSAKDVIVDEVVDLELLPASEDGAAPRCRVSLRSGAPIHAAAVIFTGSGAEPEMPQWARAALDAADDEAPPLHHSREVDLRAEEAQLGGKAVVVVGGGSAAVQLAAGAARAGASSVRLVARRPLLARPFDYEPRSLGGVFRHQCARMECPAERLKATRAARGRGSVSPVAIQDLQELSGAGSCHIAVHEGQVVSSLHRSGGRWAFSTAPTPLPVGVKMSAGNVKWDGASCGAEEGLEADVIWLATGKSSRLGVRGETDSAPGLLDAVLARYPAPVVGGYALLERPAARWPGPLPLFCVGRSAALVSGPAADQMPGLREVAQQVADYLSAHWPNLPPAEAAAPQDHLPAAPLDSELFHEQHQRPPRKQSPQVDTEALLPADLPKQDVTKYTWTDEDFLIRVTIPLPEPVTPEALHSSLLPGSLDLWAVGAKAAYRFYVPRFYQQVLVDRCTIVYSPKKQAVLVRLHKYSTEPWRFLKQ
eukprot:jgi/Tetstr1/454949/TSEL_041810.t1